MSEVLLRDSIIASKRSDLVADDATASAGMRRETSAPDTPTAWHSEREP